jgi:hypothetical protein
MSLVSESSVEETGARLTQLVANAHSLKGRYATVTGLSSGRTSNWCGNLTLICELFLVSNQS